MLLSGTNQLNLNDLVGRLRHFDRMAMLFVASYEVRIVIREWLQRFPRKGLVVARSDSLHTETAALIRRHIPKKIRTTPELIRHQYGRNASHRLGPFINHGPFDPADACADDDVEAGGSGLREVQWLVEDILRAEPGLLKVKIRLQPERSRQAATCRLPARQL